ncbi:MAG TPA: hypothetical protein VK116_04475 [Planctomycetota bacterium]|nr:hypothetical protein [Planctomycetota bacterium]
MDAVEVARTYLHRALERERLPHAWLLVGPESARPLDFAHELARTLFCQSPPADPLAPWFCGTCAACRAIDHGNHPGVELYGPEAERNVVDIKTVRALCERSQLSRDHSFVAILDRADLLNVAAANALLKTLEEPPSGFILVLVASSTGTLLPTIVSRCHRLFFSSRGTALESAAERDVVLEIARPDFIANVDLRDWLARAAPGQKAVREQVRAVLARLVEEARRELEGPSAGEGVDAAIDELDLLLELRAELDRNVHADLVVERFLASRARARR